MNITRHIACGVLWLFILVFFCLGPARAEVSLTASGISAIRSGNIPQAEKTAFEDACFKAYLDLALRQVPASASVDLVQKLKVFVASRGSQDIIQYQILSRSQQDDVLHINFDLKLNDAPLRDWLRTQSIATPLGLRPRILLTITSRGPGAAERYEWWSSGSPRGYSPFEIQLASRLRNAGENVADPPQRITAPPAGQDRPFVLASASGADLVVSGTVTYKQVDASGLDTRLDITLLDARTRQRLYSFTMTLRGAVDMRTMNELLVTALLEPMRMEIAKKVAVITPAVHEKDLCIEDISDYDTYLAVFNALRSMDAVSRITISRIQGHAICHAVQIKGTLQDILDNLKQKQVAHADMMVRGDVASIRLLNQ